MEQETMKENKSEKMAEEITKDLVNLVGLYNKLTTSDMQGHATVKARDIIGLVRGIDDKKMKMPMPHTPEWDLMYEIEDMLLEFAGMNTGATTSDLQAIAIEKAKEIIKIVNG